MNSRTVPRGSAADAKAETAGETGAPRVGAPQSAPPQDVRRLTAVFFRRLQELEEGTTDYQYARNTLIELSLPLVGFVAKRFHDREDQYEDIRQVGTIGLIKAIDRFDLSREVEFSTFAIPYIAGEIKRFFRDTTWAVHVPRRLQEQRIALARATDHLEARLGRSPTTGELAEEMTVSVGEVTEAMVASNAYSTHSLDLSNDEDGEAKEVATLLNRLGRRDPALEKVEDLNSLKPLLAGLEERDRRILEMHFGQELTQQQIGDVLGLSQMHVSRLLRRCLGELRAAMTQG